MYQRIFLIWYHLLKKSLKIYYIFEITKEYLSKKTFDVVAMIQIYRASNFFLSKILWTNFHDFLYFSIISVHKKLQHNKLMIQPWKMAMEHFPPRDSNNFQAKLFRIFVKRSEVAFPLEESSWLWGSNVLCLVRRVSPFKASDFSRPGEFIGLLCARFPLPMQSRRVLCSCACH